MTIYHVPKNIIIFSQVTSNLWQGSGITWISSSLKLHVGVGVWMSVRQVACWQLWVMFLQWKFLPQGLKSTINLCLLWLWKLLALQGLTGTRRELAAWPSSCHVGQEHRPDLVLKWICISSWQLLSVFRADMGAFQLPHLGPKSCIYKMLTQSTSFIAL